LYSQPIMVSQSVATSAAAVKSALESFMVVPFAAQ
jgi:hypothetical protein